MYWAGHDENVGDRRAGPLLKRAAAVVQISCHAGLILLGFGWYALVRWLNILNFTPG